MDVDMDTPVAAAVLNFDGITVYLQGVACNDKRDSI